MSDMAHEGSRTGKLFAVTRDWYGRFERPISSLSLIGGFIFDTFTLTRVDMFLENFFVILHLVVVGGAIIFINKHENAGSDEADPRKIHFWLVNILQFFFGGLLSVFLVFYFRSGTLAVSWPFFAVLVGAFVANERLKRYFARLSFQIALFFLCLYLFLIYFIPVLVHGLGPWIFIVSGVASLGVLALFLRILRLVSHEKFMKNRTMLAGLIGCIFFGMNVLYFSNAIPPLPIAIKTGDVYHSLVANGPGNYTVQYEQKGILGSIARFLGFDQTIHIVDGDPLYAYTTIFSPTNFDTTIIHEWQRYDPARNAWVTRSTIRLAIVGGSDGGYRTYSFQPGIEAGDWRVNVKTSGGQVIGRLQVTVATGTTEPVLAAKTID